MALLGVFPIAALVALCFRFPIPFSGYESGFDAALRSVFAVLFYGITGGFPVLFVLGAVSGIVATKLAGEDARKRRWLTVLLAIGSVFAAVMILSVLDKIIGPF